MVMKENPSPSFASYRRPGFCLLIVAMLGLLAVCAYRTGESAAHRLDRDMRARLLRRVIDISRAINPALVAKLSFTSADVDAPAYLQIRRQMIAMAAGGTQRGIYSMALRDGTIVFGPESYPENDPMASSPGMVYEQPSIEDQRIFETGTSVAYGPYTDEYGTFVTALAPVVDPRTGRVLMVAAIDVLAADWQAALNTERRRPFLIAGVLGLVALVSLAVRRRGLRVVSGRMALRRLIMTPVCIVMFCSIVLYMLYGYREYRRLQHQTEHAGYTAEQRGAGLLQHLQRAGG